MKTYITFEGKAFFFRKKILGFLALWLLIGLGLLGQILFLDYGNHEETVYNELNDTRVVLRSVETYYRESETEVTLADNLFKQQELSALKYNGILFDNADWFYDAGMELAQLRLEADEYPEEKVSSTLFPSRDISQRQFVEYEAMKQNELPVRIDSQNMYDYSTKIFSIYGSLAFLFALFLSSDIGLRDFSHPSLVKNYPIQTNVQLFIQTGITAIGGTFGLILLMGINLLIAQALWSTNDWSWPIGYYNQLKYLAIPLIQYGMKLLLYLFVLMVHTTLFSFLVNQLFKNQYVTLMVGSLLYSGGFLLSSAQSWIRWLPLPYYHLDKVLTGFLAEQVHPKIDLTRALFILFIWSILFLLISLKLTNPSIKKEKRYATN